MDEKGAPVDAAAGKEQPDGRERSPSKSLAGEPAKKDTENLAPKDQADKATSPSETGKEKAVSPAKDGTKSEPGGKFFCTFRQSYENLPPNSSQFPFEFEILTSYSLSISAF